MVKTIRIDRKDYYIFPIDFFDKLLIEINKSMDEKGTRKLMKMYRKLQKFTEMYTEEKDIIYVEVNLYFALKKKYETPF